jgi:hypothetical protein
MTVNMAQLRIAGISIASSENKSPDGLTPAPPASISGHKARSQERDYNGGRIMGAQRAWKPIGAAKHNAETEQLYLQLASLNRRIEELEKSHPETSKIEALKVSALVVSRQIDELRCVTDDLTGLLAR